MRIYDIIEKKRDGKKLSFDEIGFFVTEYTAERIADYQAATLLMAIFINGMDIEETVALTECMARSGDMLDLTVIDGITADKHSTGGVGDKTSLIVAPICASLGIKMAKMSGRGLGHTGGTVDKLESIPGYCVSLSTEEFFEQVNRIGLALIGQTGNLTPADKKLYALRDVTATVDNKSLIASSIMSKKLAAGAKNIVLDVKCGSGAFMKNESDATELAELMVKIGKDCGRNTSAIITDMDIPLGTHIGNALEIKEVIDILNNRGDERLRELCIELSAEIIRLSHRIEYSKAYAMAEKTLGNGMALEKFRELITSQGGNASVIDDPSILPTAKCRYRVFADKNGFITDMDSKLIGESAVLLGAGREKKDDIIDHGAGIILYKKTADEVKCGDLVAELFAESNTQIENAATLFNKTYKIGDMRPSEKPLIYRTIR